MSLTSTGFLLMMVTFCTTITRQPPASPGELNCRYNLTSCLAQSKSIEAQDSCIVELIEQNEKGPRRKHK